LFHRYICWNLYWQCTFDLDEEFVDEKVVCTMGAVKANRVKASTNLLCLFNENPDNFVS